MSENCRPQHIYIHVHTCVYRKRRKCSIGRTIKLDIFPRLSDCRIDILSEVWKYHYFKLLSQLYTMSFCNMYIYISYLRIFSCYSNCCVLHVYCAISNSRAMADKMATPTMTDRTCTKPLSPKAVQVTFPGKWP